jgi:hypothetical protein
MGKTVNSGRNFLCGGSFVEDRLATLQNVVKDPELDQWNLYLATWGYNTLGEREAAATVPRIKILDLPDFCGKLK